MVAGLKNLSQKLKDMGVGEETHEPVENLEPASSGLAVGDLVYLISDGKAFSGTIFEFQDDGFVAGLKDLSEKLASLGAGFARLPRRTCRDCRARAHHSTYMRVAWISRVFHREETHEPCENLALKD